MSKYYLRKCTYSFHSLVLLNLKLYKNRIYSISHFPYSHEYSNISLLWHPHSVLSYRENMGIFTHKNSECLCLFLKSREIIQIHSYRRNKRERKCLKNDISDAQRIRKKCMSLYKSTSHWYSRTIWNREMTNNRRRFCSICNNSNRIWLRSLILWTMCASCVSLFPWCMMWICCYRSWTLRETRCNQYYLSDSLNYHQYWVWSYGIPWRDTRANCQWKMRNHQT